MDSFDSDFELFMETVEPRIRAALVAQFGSVAGRQAAVDALSFVWERFEKVRVMENPAGYVFTIGRRLAMSGDSGREVLFADVLVEGAEDDLMVEPKLIAALGSLSEQQRIAVVMIHVYGHTVRSAAELLGLAASTVQRNSERGLAHLAELLEGDEYVR